MKVSILGIRGVPATHGGFETFAERLALHLVALGHEVTVYCQADAAPAVREDTWEGIRRVHVPTGLRGAAGTIAFDWKATAHACAQKPDVALVLGYNTAVFCARLRMARVPVAINMDGIEWKRAKWGVAAKAWFRLNEFLGCLLGDVLIADHPEIATHLSRHGCARGKLEVIPYGADDLADTARPDAMPCGVRDGGYFSVIARPEPENSVREIVAAFSRKPRGVQLLVLGAYDFNGNGYHRQVRECASNEVVFAGAIYDAPSVRAIRRGSIAYVHGHTVGGTNPSLVEAMGAGSAVLAHDNAYNRWVVADGAVYFSDVDQLDAHFDALCGDVRLVDRLGAASTARFRADFQWHDILARYCALLSRLSNKV